MREHNFALIFRASLLFSTLLSGQKQFGQMNTIKTQYINYPLKSIRVVVQIFSILLLAILPMHFSMADEVAAGPLVVHGNIESAGDTRIEISLETLMALEPTTFITSAPWTDEPTEYTGVRVNTFLNSIGALSSSFKATASNDYHFLLRDIDFDKYPIIIAYKKNGKVLDARTLGPFLIMFPFDDFPELLNEKNKAASVWQLTEFEVL